MTDRARYLSSLVIFAALIVPAGMSGCAEVFSTDRRTGLYSPPRNHWRERAPSGGIERIAPTDGTMVHRDWGTNANVYAEDDHLSTFAVDVDTASYDIASEYLRRGQLPPPAAVRTEEFINAMKYEYPSPAKDDLAIHLEACPSLVSGEILLRVALQSRRIHSADRKPANLTIVIDTSGSMSDRNKLDMVRTACQTLLDSLHGHDLVSVVRYNHQASTVLRGVRASERGHILHAIRRLRPGGKTSVEAGLKKGYQLAGELFEKDRTNHVLLFSDGVANTDRIEAEQILWAVGHWRRKNITLTTVGVGFGNYNDTLLEQLADNGDGSYHYVNSIRQAERLLCTDLAGTSQIVARDVKVQVKFDPAVVLRYRLMGYENRDVADEDFRNKCVDGGEIVASQSVTALYALRLKPMANPASRLAKVSISYKRPHSTRRRELRNSIRVREILGDWRSAGDSTRLAAVAGYFAEHLRDSYASGQVSLQRLGAEVKTIHVRPIHRDELQRLAELIATSGRLAAGQTENSPSRVLDSLTHKPSE